jgi:hypothetical protein
VRIGSLVRRSLLVLRIAVRRTGTSRSFALRLDLLRGIALSSVRLSRSFLEPSFCLVPAASPKRFALVSTPSGHTLVGFFALSTTSGSESGHPGFTSPGTFPPRGFSPPRGFTPHCPLRSCFIPLPPLGFSPSELFPPNQPRPSPAPYPHDIARLANHHLAAMTTKLLSKGC